MKTIIKHILPAVAVLCAILSASASNTVSYSCSFSSSDYTVKDSVFNGKTYSVVSYQDNPVIADQTGGAPSLPYRVILVSVPYNSSNFRVRINNADYNSTELQHCVVPVQTPVSMNATEMPPFVEPDPAYYNSGIFPRTEAEVLDETLLGGFNKVVRVVINQCRYNHAESRLSKLEKIDLTLEWDDCANPANLHPIVPALSGRVAENIEYTKEFVVNPEDVETNGTVAKNRMKKTAQETDSVEMFEYLIVTTREFAESLRPLEYMRKLRGFTTRIACIEDILANPKYAMGDTISNINDDAGKLRAYLTDVYTNNGTKYVLLAGKYPRIPVREDFFVREEIGTDLYFAELNTKWTSATSNCSMYYRPLSDFNSELYIGRLNFKSKEEINNYITKIYYYEFNPGNGNPRYLGNTFVYVCSGTGGVKYTYEEDMRDTYHSIFQDIVEQYQTAYDFPKGKDIINMLNSTNYGYVDFQCHGNPEGVQLTKPMDGKSEVYGLNALDRETVNHTVESGSGLDCWKNKYYPNWSHSMSCTLMPFKESYLKDGITPLTYNFGESYTLGKNYGGVAFIGNTGPGDMTYSNKIQRFFFEEYIRDITTKYKLIGELVAKEKIDFYIRYGNFFIILEKLNLFGDPATHLWWGVPSVLKENSSHDFDPTSLSDYAEYKVVKISIDNNSIADVNYYNKQTLQSYDFSSDYLYVLTSPRCIPFIMPLRIHKTIFSNENTYICNRLNLGVDESSNVLFDSGAKITFYTTDEVIIDYNTEFEENSTVEIHSNKTVYLKSMTVYDGANLTISAPNVVMGPGCLIDKGANFIIKNTSYK